LPGASGGRATARHEHMSAARSDSPLAQATGASALPCALLPASLFALLVGGLISVPLPWSVSWRWIPALDLQFALYVDGLAAQFLLLITGIGTLVAVYGAGYLAGDGRRWRVFALLLLFMLAMIGAVCSDHLLLLFVFWELTSVLSFLLVGFDHARESSRKSAQQALLITGTGGLFLLAGIILLAEIGGSCSLRQLIAAAPAFADDARLPAALTLLFLGAFSKSAQFPFHFWLPNAMAAPTPVSAYLHSATLVKLGIYLLARLDAAFSDLLFWEYALVGIGTLTAVLAAVQTVRERDLKRILAWSTVATLGTLTMLVGLPGQGAALAVAALFFAHALYKAPLFFVAGNLDHGAGTRDIDRLTGMRRYLPWTATAALLAALSMAGLPLSFGFVGCAARPADRATHPHEAPLPMLLPPLLLVALGLLFGLRPTLVDPLLGAAAQAIAPGFDPLQVDSSYDAWPVAEASIATLFFGLLIYFGWDRLHALLDRARELDELGPESWYWRKLKFIPKLASWVTRRLQHGVLSGYLLTLAGAVALALLAALLAARPELAWPSLAPLPLPVVGCALLIVGGALAALLVRDHLVLLLVSGLVGYGSALLFLFTGAPDLAFTQFAVETVFVVVAATVLRRLRQMPTPLQLAVGEARWRPLALLVALAFSLALGTLLLLAAGLPFEAQLSDYFAAESLPAAHGRNVVNVIIVDFRALDTLGEIAVVAMAFVAALPLLQLARGRS